MQWSARLTVVATNSIWCLLKNRIVEARATSMNEIAAVLTQYVLRQRSRALVRAKSSMRVHNATLSTSIIHTRKSWVASMLYIKSKQLP